MTGLVFVFNIEHILKLNCEHKADHSVGILMEFNFLFSLQMHVLIMNDYSCYGQECEDYVRREFFPVCLPFLFFEVFYDTISRVILLQFRIIILNN